jgi:hypothetical protein
MPPLPLAAAQVAVGAVNFALVSACLHQVLLIRSGAVRVAASTR